MPGVVAAVLERHDPAAGVARRARRCSRPSRWSSHASAPRHSPSQPGPRSAITAVDAGRAVDLRVTDAEGHPETYRLVVDPRWRAAVDDRGRWASRTVHPSPGGWPLPPAGAFLRQVVASLWRAGDDPAGRPVSASPALPARGARAMRVLLASDFFHPVIGGAERQVGLLAAALARRGHEVRVATTAQPGLAPREVVEGVAVDRLASLASALPAPGRGQRFLPPAPDPLLSVGLHRLVLDWRPDVVHASGWIAYSSAAAVLDHAAPLVLSVRDYGHACATRNLLWHDRAVCDGPSLGRCLDCAGRHYGAARALIAVSGVRGGRPLLRSDRAGHPQRQRLRPAYRRAGPAPRRSPLAADPGTDR